MTVLKDIRNDLAITPEKFRLGRINNWAKRDSSASLAVCRNNNGKYKQINHPRGIYRVKHIGSR